MNYEKKYLEALEKQGKKDKVTIKKGEQEPTWSEKDEGG